MSIGGLDRRALLFATAVAALSASAGEGSLAQASDTTDSFDEAHVRRLAAQLAAVPFAPSKAANQEQLKRLQYDQYRDVRFRPEMSLWRGEGIGHEVQFFPLGWLYDSPVEMYVVERGSVRRIAASPEMFSFGQVVGEGAKVAAEGFSGFRLHAPLNRPDYFDEYLVFQGASYFRAVARGQVYGLSARGLALGTAKPGGEEFPLFRAFWIEKPLRANDPVIVHALLDSASTTGAYRFTVTAGEQTVMTVEATLFPRRELTHAGIAPLTSMFLLGAADYRHRADFRPAVHDSEGLSIITGKGEYVWRPLINPRTLQSSAFVDRDPKGFGLLQRDRRFTTYEDLEARYERRPSLWIEPIDSWGDGYVELIEIPTEEEIHDNIAVAWRPKQPFAAGRPASLAYRMIWSASHPRPGALLRVAKTRAGAGRKAGQVLFVVDFDGDWMQAPRELPKLDVATSGGSVHDAVIQHNPDIQGLRTSFVLDPGTAPVAELRLRLLSQAGPVSETWLYRWTRA